MLILENLINQKEICQNSVVEKVSWNSKDIPRGKIGEGMSFGEKQKLLESTLRQDREKQILKVVRDF